MSAHILLYMKRVDVRYMYMEMFSILSRKNITRKFIDRIVNVLYTEWDDNECTSMKQSEGITCDVPMYIQEEIMCHIAENCINNEICFSEFSDIARYDICANLKYIVWPSDEPLSYPGQMITVNPQLVQAIVYHYEIKWSQQKGRSVHNVFEILSLQIQSDVLFEIYGMNLYNASIFKSKTKSFFKNLVPKTRHEIICKEGYAVTINDITKYIYIVCKGEFEILAPDGTVTTTVLCGGMFGNLQNKKRSRLRISAVACCHSEVLMITALEFHKLLEYEPQIKDEYVALIRIYFNYIPGSNETKKTIRSDNTYKAQNIKKSIWLYVFNPNTLRMQIWNAINLTFSCYVCIILDLYQLCSTENSIIMLVMQYTCDVLYAAQYCLKFRIAYEDEWGTLITDLRQIAKKQCENKFRLLIGTIIYIFIKKMDLVGTRRKRNYTTIISNSLKDSYPHNLQMYSFPPGNEIQLSEFEELALERLQLFRTIEYTTQKGLRIYSEEWKECVYGELIKNELKRYLRLAKSTDFENPSDIDLQARRADHISHFILRLAYCRTESLRKWFLARELEWFKLRFLQQSPKSIEKFLKLNNLTYTSISPEEKAKFYSELSDSTANAYAVDQLNFYKVRFTEVPSLIKSRRVFVHKGYAYIPNFELVTCILGIFRSSLNEALVYANRRLPLMDDDRINFLITNLHNIYTGKDYSQNFNSGKVGLTSLDVYARDHFPLCMKYVYGILKSTHHLKHDCRLQLGLFLKGIGLTYEDSMTFWKNEFTKKIDSGKFDKEYAYNIKHMYGLVGQRTSYSAYSCIKIISSNVGVGDHHGCPYKHWDSVILRTKLNELGMTTEAVEDIVNTASKGHYQIACCKHFEYIHGQQNKVAISHPNQYFEESLECSKENKNQKSQDTPKIVKKQKANDTTLEINDIDWNEDI
ncbi:dna primase large subunit [Holotrichia oblita]|uniref:Dna primase large subunit n=2 Tax=Holotrichia oblita TaxID=644536 RepID=A0ACB9TFV9_HOLOL|nr:dna primase large subunit [Holotrichia oblita]